MSRRRLLGIPLAWLAVVGLAWGGVGLPERCPELTPEEATAAAEATVDWFERNQLADGRWVYRYNVDTDEIVNQPHVVRHSGVTMALYQADRAGITRAREIADRGADWSLRHLNRHEDLAMVPEGRYAPSGGAALLVAGLSTRRLTSGDPTYDAELFALGRFLVAMTEPSGAVLQRWDTRTDTPVPDEHSPFFTGEAYYALGLLSQVDPDGTEGDWAPTVARIGHYLATERDETEDRYPPTSDHWGAYGLATEAEADAGDGAHQPTLDEDRVAYAERLAEIFSIQVRYESQRTGEGINLALRGPQALGAGLGTLGEGLGALWRLTGEGQPLEQHHDAIGQRLRCTAGVLAQRQLDEADAAEAGHPELAQGAWFRQGWTQKDDQQHALSALLSAMPALAEAEAKAEGDDGDGGTEATPAGDDSLPRVLWLMVIMVALVNPIRLRGLLAGSQEHPAAPPPAQASTVGVLVTGAVLAGLAAVAEPTLRAIDVSPPTATIAAGLVVGLTAIVDFLHPKVDPLTGVGGRAAWLVPTVVPGLLRPAGAVLTLAVAADVGVPAGLAVAGAAAACGLVFWGRPSTGTPTALEQAGWRACATLGVVGGVALMLNGIFAI